MDSWHTKYIGIPFVDNGRSMSGCDCGGLAWLVFKQELGRELDCFISPYTALHAISAGKNLRYAIGEFFAPAISPRPLNLAVFGRTFGDYHVGVFIDNGRNILHCKEGYAAKIQRLGDMDCRNDYRGAYALI